MVREILALGLSNDKERIGVKTALCFGLQSTYFQSGHDRVNSFGQDQYCNYVLIHQLLKPDILSTGP